jgi:Telomeric repeat-binding factor 2.
MKKVVILLMLGISLVLGAGCSTQNKTTGSDGKKSESEKVTKSDSLLVNDLDLLVNHFTEKNMVNIQQKKQEKRTVFTAHVVGKNISRTSKGLGAIDFRLKTAKGKEISVSSNFVSFGEEIPADATIKGDLFFELSEGDKPAEIEYKPATKVLATWTVMQ